MSELVTKRTNTADAITLVEEVMHLYFPEIPSGVINIRDGHMSNPVHLFRVEYIGCRSIIYVNTSLFKKLYGKNPASARTRAGIAISDCLYNTQLYELIQNDFETGMIKIPPDISLVYLVKGKWFDIPDLAILTFARSPDLADISSVEHYKHMRADKYAAYLAAREAILTAAEEGNCTPTRIRDLFLKYI